MNVLVVGKNGYLGNYLTSNLNKKFKLDGTAFSNIKKGDFYLNLENKSEIKSFLEKYKVLIDAIIFCAGNPSLEFSENNKKQSHQANVLNVKNFVSSLVESKHKNAHFILLSSIYVFGGNDCKFKESDTPNPINLYGKQKLEAETFCLKKIKNLTVLRLPWVIGNLNHEKDLIIKNLKILKTNQILNLDSKDIRFPTHCYIVSKIIEFIIKKNICGIIHVPSSNTSFTHFKLIQTFLKAKKSNLLKSIKNNGIYPDPKINKIIAKRPKKIKLTTEYSFIKAMKPSKLFNELIKKDINR